MTFYFGGSSGHPLADKRYTMALQLAEWGDHVAASDLLRQGLELAPSWPPMHFHFGEELRQSGKAVEARKAFESYLALDMDDQMGALLKLTLLGVCTAPPIMPEAYVQSLFDQYAPHFDTCLVEKLSYNVPALMADAVRKINAGPYGRLLDMGCGTGLATAKFMHDTNHRCGCDLSSAMAEQSRAKNLFHEIHAKSIDMFLAQDTNEPYDLALCADVLIYIGALEKIFSRLFSRMIPGGIFAFSVQTLNNGTWSLGEDHRYAHSESYIQTCINHAGFFLRSATPVTLRMDAGEAVKGIIFVCEKPA